MKTDCVQNYEKLALLYDLFMEGIDYEAWVSYVEEIIKRFQGNVRSVADLACGTGNSTLPWGLRGYRVCGVDFSGDMLKIARAKAIAKKIEIDFLYQDLCDLKLPEPVDLAVCFQDGVNYILTVEGLRKAFRSVSGNLTAGGFFIFDLNYMPRIVPENEEFSMIEDERYSLAWQAKYLEKEKLWEIEVRGSLKNQEHCRGTFSEKHKERIYEAQDIWALLAAQGFTVLGNYQAFKFEPPHDQSPRIVCVAQKIV